MIHHFLHTVTFQLTIMSYLLPVTITELSYYLASSSSLYFSFHIYFIYPLEDRTLFSITHMKKSQLSISDVSSLRFIHLHKILNATYIGKLSEYAPFLLSLYVCSFYCWSYFIYIFFLNFIFCQINERGTNHQRHEWVRYILQTWVFFFFLAKLHFLRTLE